MTTPTTPREPLDLEALERAITEEVAEAHRAAAADGTHVDPNDIAASLIMLQLLARIRELEAERPDWSDEQIEDLCQRTMDMPHPSEVMRENLRAAGIVPNVARWRDISEAPKDGTPIVAVLRADIYPRIRPQRPDLASLNGLYMVLRHPGGSYGWNAAGPLGFGGIDDEWIAGWMAPLPARPTTEATAP
jgi:hypothetical protein